MHYFIGTPYKLVYWQPIQVLKRTIIAQSKSIDLCPVLKPKPHWDKNTQELVLNQEHQFLKQDVLFPQGNSFCLKFKVFPEQLSVKSDV